MEKFSRRLVRVLPEHNAQCQDLLRLMGVPFIIVRLAMEERGGETTIEIEQELECRAESACRYVKGGGTWSF